MRMLIAEDDADTAKFADDGPGVAAEDRERITRRFARLDSSRDTPGHGLGLSLVAAVAHVHDGALLVEDNQPGVIVTIMLPRRPQ